jgi:cysteinyl-tRNA synthetase
LVLLAESIAADAGPGIIGYPCVCTPAGIDEKTANLPGVIPMTIYLHDTLKARKVAFEPREAGHVTMYLCGPTVYNFAHIGNARPAVVFDLLARLLRRSYKLTFARNITDVDDKINAAAQESGKSIDEITERFIKAYNDDMAVLGVLPPDIEPRATRHIDEMIEMIKELVDKGFAYEAEGHVLFEVEANENYGQLSKRNLREMIAGSRVEIAPYKRSAHDFVLWKPSTPDLPGWDSPWGRGRPGWHIECSAMAGKHLGRTIDIHAGGQDLIFPHHENELAQSTCAHDGDPFARYWLHNGFLSIEHEKMSKSVGNVLLVHDLIKTIPGEVIRLALLSAHYRQPLDWSGEAIESAKRMLDRLYGAVRGIDVSADDRSGTEPPAAVIAALEDDLNTPKAMAEIFNLARTLNKSSDEAEQSHLAAEILAAGDLVALLQNDPEDWFTGSQDSELTDSEIETLLASRNEFRAEKDFRAADAIRDKLAAKGVSIEDGPDGTRWRRC